MIESRSPHRGQNWWHRQRNEELVGGGGGAQIRTGRQINKLKMLLRKSKNLLTFEMLVPNAFVNMPFSRIVI
jgi:hypothetical protein